MLYSEKMKEICEKLGIDCSKLPNNLYSTLLNEICNCCGTGSGGNDEVLKGLIDNSITEIVIPEGTSKIRMRSFSNCDSLEKVTIPNSVTSIENNAFYYCSNLTDIQIATSVTSIGYGAFNYCSNLTNIKIPNSVTKIEDEVFRDCQKLTQITIPNSVKTIGIQAFRNCYALKNVTFEEPCQITSLTGLFIACSSIEYFEVPSSVTSMGSNPFGNCVKLATIRMKSTTPPKLTKGTLDDTYTPALTTIEVPMEAVETYKAATNWSAYADKIVGY